MLRLVGGTDVKAVAQQESSTSEELARVRQLVLDYNFAGKPVREWIREPDLPTDEPLGSARALTMNMLQLNKLGVLLLKNGHEHGLANDTYGTVVDTKLLFRRIPELKMVRIDLAGLALYY